MSSCNEGEDPVDGIVGGQGAVVDDEVTFQTLRNIVSATTGLDHCSLKSIIKTSKNNPPGLTVL